MQVPKRGSSPSTTYIETCSMGTGRGETNPQRLKLATTDGDPCTHYENSASTCGEYRDLKATKYYIRGRGASVVGCFTVRVGGEARNFPKISSERGN